MRMIESMKIHAKGKEKKCMYFHDNKELSIFSHRSFILPHDVRQTLNAIKKKGTETHIIDT